MTELVETRQQLLDDVNVALGPIVVNGMDTYSLTPLPESAPSYVKEAWEYRTQRQHAQQTAVAMLQAQVSESTLLLPKYSSTATTVTDMVEDLRNTIESLEIEGVQ